MSFYATQKLAQTILLDLSLMSIRSVDVQKKRTQILTRRDQEIKTIILHGVKTHSTGSVLKKQNGLTEMRPLLNVYKEN